jgi:hypothetical protein
MATTTIDTLTPSTNPGGQFQAAIELVGLSDLTAELEGIFERMDWAEEEIEKALAHHPYHRDLLWHSFALIRPREVGPRMSTEMLYRSHAAELLDRVAAGADTRGPTAAEMVVVCLEVSKAVPMHGDSAGLYFRVWARAFPNHSLTAEQADTRNHYEKLFGSRIDVLEQDVARRLTADDRVHGDIDCRGYHHGKPVTCRFTERKDTPKDRRFAAAQAAARAARAGRYAAKFAAETVHDEPAFYEQPTDEAFAARFAHCGKVPPAVLYPDIRAAFLAQYADDIAALTAADADEQTGTYTQLDLWGPVLAEMGVA